MNLSLSKLEDCAFVDCRLNDAALSELKLKRLRLDHCDLTRAELFRTPLKGIDLSSCPITAITLSDSRAELAGAKVGMAQCVDLALMLGVKIV